MNTFMDALTTNENPIPVMVERRIERVLVLVDLNFSVPSLRNAAINFYGKSKANPIFMEAHRMEAVDALRLFITSYEEDPLYTMKWLMYARHIKLGLGERDAFRMMLTKIGDLYPKWLCNLSLVLSCGIMVVGMMYCVSILIRLVMFFMTDWGD